MAIPENDGRKAAFEALAQCRLYQKEKDAGPGTMEYIGLGEKIRGDLFGGIVTIRPRATWQAHLPRLAAPNLCPTSPL